MRMRPLGTVIDIAILSAVSYLAWNHPVAQIVTGRHATIASLADLPTPVKTPGAVAHFAADALHFSPEASLKVESWWNFMLDKDQGQYVHVLTPEAASFQATNMWKNDLLLPSFITQSLPHMLATWLRNMFSGWVLYFVCGSLWCWFIYRYDVKRCFPDPSLIPERADVLQQIGVSARAMVFYSAAPTIAEWLIERGFTYAYHDLSIVGGLGMYVFWLVVYFTFVEWGIFWAHYSLHFPALYWLHKPHHIYNNRNSLSPFAGLAFDPFDGLVQASPYVIGLFFMPVHFWTHEVLLFFTAVWTTNIHDALIGDTEPVMGSAYHTIHHTTYKYNYGQVFLLFDWLHDTMAPPKHRREQWGWNTPTGYDASKPPGVAALKED